MTVDLYRVKSTKRTFVLLQYVLGSNLEHDTPIQGFIIFVLEV